MRICGMKLTHDGAVALIDDGKLIFCIEQEKVRNNRRYQPIREMDDVRAILSGLGYDLEDIDRFVIDGWDGHKGSQITLLDSGTPTTLRAGPYIEFNDVEIFKPQKQSGLIVNKKSIEYSSFPHVSGHIASAYCTSKFAVDKLDAYCLVWDGAMFPRLYYIDPALNKVTLVNVLFPIIGHAYAAAGQHFGPFKQINVSSRAADLGVAGKLMAYIAKGSVKPAICSAFKSMYHLHFARKQTKGLNEKVDILGVGMSCEPSLQYLHHYFLDCAKLLEKEDHADILASFHAFLEDMLVTKLADSAAERGLDVLERLCIVGGCALNIKWNSAIRRSGIAREIWVPPFPNDSGSAIGVACCSLISQQGLNNCALEWNVYSGPELLPVVDLPPGWRTSPCEISELARLLATGEVVVFLTGRAELGPRALGARSILASPSSLHMKYLLNTIKKREQYRPIAPICLADRAQEIFFPGTLDPYMLFDHETLSTWKEKIPAVIHLDGTARLQTVERHQREPIAKVLIEFESLTGIPLLCNTSANYHGRGFFPDVKSACEWGEIKNVWSENVLYRKY